MIDDYEKMAKSAFYHRYAMNAKNAKEKKLFDADKARKRLDAGSEDWKDSRKPSVSIDKYRKAKEAMDKYMKSISKEGKADEA
ncbi:hypothetical protein [Jeotgalibacillus haloalkalitolerans]|nr:hypothetical protein [Jeotgalibacillus sp. HH7-29]